MSNVQATVRQRHNASDDLLAMKRIANRPKDQLDIVALEKIKRGEDPNV